MTAFPFHKSAFTLALLLVVGAAAGCGNKRQDAVEPPLWQTEEGKQETRIGIARKMLAMGYADEAMTLLKLAREHSGWIYARAAPAGALLHSLLGQLLGLHAVSLREAVGSDAAFALLLMGSLQVGTFFVVHSSLRAVRLALRRASTGAELSAAELQGIAAAMSDPRQCGRCGVPLAQPSSRHAATESPTHTPSSSQAAS